jgi:hypothetical protein
MSDNQLSMKIDATPELLKKAEAEIRRLKAEKLQLIQNLGDALERNSMLRCKMIYPGKRITVTRGGLTAFLRELQDFDDGEFEL